MSRNRVKPQRVWTIFVFVVLFSVQVFAADEDFAIIALPDTQIYSQNHPQIFKAQADWIVANAEKLNIKMVLHEGDVVNKGANDYLQWPNAKSALDIIDQAGIPMFIAIGNHDYDDMAKTRNATVFNRFFGMDRYTTKPWFGGSFEADRSENVYGFVTAGGRDHLVFALEFAPRQAVVDWANNVIAQYPQHDVIIVTHNYLYSDGTHHNRLNQTGTYGVSSDANTGKQLWDNLVSKNPNTVLVLSGHVGGDGLAQRSDITAHGNLVHQIETNFQFNKLGGEGYLRILKYRPSVGTIEVTTYSPYLDAYYTDPDNEFVMPYNPSTKSWESVTIEGQATNALVSLQQQEKTLNADWVDAHGKFLFRVLPGTYTLKIVASGPATYETVEATDPGKEYVLQPITPQVFTTDASVTADEDARVWAGYGGNLAGKLAEGAAADIVMKNNKLTFVIANTFNDPQLPNATLGKPIDMAAIGLVDGIDWMNFPYLSLEQPIWDNSGAITTVQNQSVRIVSVTPEAAVVEAAGIYTEVDGVTVRTTYTLRPDEEWVYAISTFSNPTSQDLTLWAGDVMDNDDGKQHVYVPGVGDLGPGTKGRKEYQPTAAWVGHYGDAAQGYAFIYDSSFDGFFNFGANITVMTQKQITIPAGGQYEIHRYIVVVPSAGYNHKMDAVKDVYERIQALD